MSEPQVLHVDTYYSAIEIIVEDLWHLLEKPSIYLARDASAVRDWYENVAKGPGQVYDCVTAIVSGLTFQRLCEWGAALAPFLQPKHMHSNAATVEYGLAEVLSNYMVEQINARLSDRLATGYSYTNPPLVAPCATRNGWWFGSTHGPIVEVNTGRCAIGLHSDVLYTPMPRGLSIQVRTPREFDFQIIGRLLDVDPAPDIMSIMYQERLKTFQVHAMHDYYIRSNWPKDELLRMLVNREVLTVRDYKNARTKQLLEYLTTR